MVYGIRLLIVGTGIAAIVGTLLSTLKPTESSLTAGQNPRETLPAIRPQNQQRQQRGVLPQRGLPLAQELAHLKTDLVGLEAMTPGLVQSTFLYDLDTGNYVDLNGSEAISAASTIKLPVLVAFLEAVDSRRLTLDQALTLREDLRVGGSGEMQTHEAGQQYPAWEVATEMIISSDNTATNMVIELLGGSEVLNQRFQAWGLGDTVIRNPLPDLDGTNTTSPMDLVRLLALIDQGELLTLRSRDRLLGILSRTYNRSLIPDGLGDASALVFNKTGDIGNALGDVVLVDAGNGKRYALSISVARPHNDGRANELIRRLAGRIHEEMDQPVSPAGVGLPSATPPSAPPLEADPSLSSPPEAVPDRSVPPNSGTPRG